MYRVLATAEDGGILARGRQLGFQPGSWSSDRYAYCTVVRYQNARPCGHLQKVFCPHVHCRKDLRHADNLRCLNMYGTHKGLSEQTCAHRDLVGVQRKGMMANIIYPANNHQTPGFVCIFIPIYWSN